MTTYNLKSNATKIINAFIKEESSPAQSIQAIIDFFNNCNTIPEAELLADRLYAMQAKLTGTKTEQSASFTKFRKRINDRLLTLDFPFAKKNTVSVKSADKNNHCKITVRVAPKGGKKSKPSKRATKTPTSKAQTVNQQSKAIAKTTGADHGERLSTIMQVKSDCGIDTEEMILTLFATLPMAAQQACVDVLTAKLSPVPASTKSLKKLVTA